MAEETLERFQKEEKLEAGHKCRKEEKLEAHKGNQKNKIVESTTANRCPKRIILLAPGVKIPWSLISRNHQGFKANDLQNAAKKLDAEKIGKLVKEKISNAKRATTYFVKTVVDKDCDMDTSTEFANKLADYSIEIKEYMDICKQPDSQERIDENEEKMDTIPSFDDVSLVRNNHRNNMFRQVTTDSNNTLPFIVALDKTEDVLMIDREKISVAKPFTKKCSDILNLTLPESYSEGDSDTSQMSAHSAIVGSPTSSVDENIDPKEQTEERKNNKRSKQPDASKSPSAKRPLLQSSSIIFRKDFRESASFDRPEFLLWLKSNQHLRTIRGGTSKICELLDRVRVENRGLNKIFFDFVENGEKANPYFFDIEQLVRHKDVVIDPPHWGKRKDKGVTYVWSFDIPVKDLQRYCEELEREISDHPHRDIHRSDYRPRIVAQFRNYLDNELPLHENVEVFHWLYLGQTKRSPPYRRWREYYKKEIPTQRTLTFAMKTLIERNVFPRLVVVSSDGSGNMEAVVGALLNICVNSNENGSNAINSSVLGGTCIKTRSKRLKEQWLALQKYNPDSEMIICVHCNTKLRIHRESRNNLISHRCAASGLRKNDNRGSATVSSILFTKSNWCPNKDSCKACTVIVPRPEDDIMKDLPLEEILQKDEKWKRKRQRLILSTLDFDANKIVCMHCNNEVTRTIRSGGNSISLRHNCSAMNERTKDGKLPNVTSNLFEVCDWCTDRTNCKSCIQIVERGDPEIDGSHITADERRREVLRNCDFDRKMIICVPCNKPQKRENPTIFSLHICVNGNHFRSRLFQKMQLCPDKNCKECLRIVERNK